MTRFPPGQRAISSYLLGHDEYAARVETERRHEGEIACDVPVRTDPAPIRDHRDEVAGLWREAAARLSARRRHN